MAKKMANTGEISNIKEGSVAEFFRKRTQLVGFDFGLNKFTQYCIEFIDNSLDAIENFHWKESKKHPKYAFKLKDDLILETFSYSNPIFEEDIKSFESKLESEMVDDEGNPLADDGTLLLDDSSDEDTDEKILIDEEQEETQILIKDSTSEDDEEARNIRKLQKQANELEVEVQNIMYGLDGFLYPIKALIEREPFVIFQLTEREAQEVYADISKDSKEVYEYTLDVFDNGTGMGPLDLEKFGRYLASSKSKKLKQTRGSQGFGSPSAFSDAQNTTGQPITVVSKDMNHIYGTCSQFYTTSKNSKEYIVPPTEVTTEFEHGTFISLNFLNVKYRKGYIDSYIQQTALTNPHVSVIYLDPSGQEMIYPRRVKGFPREPTYALPHPSSVNIGDFQDLLRLSDKLSISSFLQDNYVRMSSSLAKTIISSTEVDLEEALSLLFVDNNLYLTWARNQKPIYLMQYENRIFGRSKKARDKLIIYNINSEVDLENYWNILTPYNKKLDNINKIIKKNRKIQKSTFREADKKIIKKLKKQYSDNEKEIQNLKKDLEKLKKNLLVVAKPFKISKNNEITDNKITDDFEDKVKELTVSKARPNSLTQKQTEALYKSFKAQKYLAPPSDPAVPIGASVLETTFIKEFNLNPAHRSDLFLEYITKLPNLSKLESNLFSNKILSRFKREPYLNNEFSKNNLFGIDDQNEIESYQQLFQNYDVSFTHDEDFIMGYTRPPTSGKGLAFVVEAVVTISPKIPTAKKAQQVLMRYVNRTPKMRDNSDCAIWKGVQSVNWKNYKLDTFDNGLPKGNIQLLVNVSGPYVHLMFKSQSKNALAEDEVLLTEIKLCLENIGRKIRHFQNKKTNRENNRKRTKVIEKFIPLFVESLCHVATQIDEFKAIKTKQLEERILDRLEGRIKQTLEELEEEKSEKDQQEKAALTVENVQKQLKSRKIRSSADEGDQTITVKEEVSELPVKINLSENVKLKPRSASGPKPVRNIDDFINNKSQSVSDTQRDILYSSKPEIPIKRKKISVKGNKSSKIITKPLKMHKSASASSSTITKPSSISKKPQKLVKPESKISLISTNLILDKIPENEWVSIKDLIKLLEIRDLKDARFLQLKLKQLTREKQLLISIRSGKTYWKVNKK